ncbi:lipopolysaccharide assembly protein LapA domain-containing protein [Pelagibacterium xiamenense]|uniref:lipopolysaccharide assembly protein LapA domain-containing protein n=1 Tax=Pelagibacterium xiamenense TaxID=2901140 RepID=UPI001E5EB9FA|nr:LapA family protein [Pelagibacterium xiamenense]MCD7058574.1 LapA family protein [Pelagibacterium xiamenense]
MAKRIIGWLVLIPLCAVILVFALANRHPVPVNFNPLISVDPAAPGAGVPLFLIIYAVLFFGIALGGIAVWFAQGQHRRAERRWRKEAEKLQRELEGVRGRPARRETDPALAAADELA